MFIRSGWPSLRASPRRSDGGWSDGGRPDGKWVWRTERLLPRSSLIAAPYDAAISLHSCLRGDLHIGSAVSRESFGARGSGPLPLPHCILSVVQKGVARCRYGRKPLGEVLVSIDRASLGYAVGARHRGQGLASRGAGLLTARPPGTRTALSTTGDRSGQRTQRRCRTVPGIPSHRRGAEDGDREGQNLPAAHLGPPRGAGSGNSRLTFRPSVVQLGPMPVMRPERRSGTAAPSW